MNTGKEYLSEVEDIKSLFSLILEMSQEQLVLAGNLANEPELSGKMLELLDRRQKVMNKIDSLSASIETIESNSFLPRLRRDAKPKKTKVPEQDISKGNEQILQIIYSIQENDRQSKATIERISKQVGSKLASARTNKKAYNAYMQEEPNLEGWFFDRKK